MIFLYLIGGTFGAAFTVGIVGQILAWLDTDSAPDAVGLTILGISAVLGAAMGAFLMHKLGQ